MPAPIFSQPNANTVSETLPDHYDDLDAILMTAWDMIAAGAEDRHAASHTVTLATVGTDGAPRARIVVLRGCSPDARHLRVHTDRRSAKVDELAAEPRCSVLHYDPEAKIQVRLDARATVTIDGGDWMDAWAATQGFSRECYRVTDPSGAPLTHPSDARFSADATNDGADNFAVILITVDAVEWLYLHNEGHRRARFSWNGATAAWTGQWLVP